MRRFKNILCVVDTAETFKPIIERAVALAENNQAALTVVDVTSLVPVSKMLEEGLNPTTLQAAIDSLPTQSLKALAEQLSKTIRIQTKVLTGIPFLEITREVLRNGHDLVIKMPENPDWLERLFGSNDMHLLRKCPCPVWLIRSTTSKTFQRILVAVDVDDGYSPAELKSRRALNNQLMEMASSLALTDSAELHIVHAWEAIGEGKIREVFTDTQSQQISRYLDQVRKDRAAELDTLLREVFAGLGAAAESLLKHQTHLLRGEARKEIPLLAKHIDADLVIMGTVARTGVPGFIVGNTAETILDQLNCSVLAIKPPGFITPITLET